MTNNHITFAANAAIVAFTPREKVLELIFNALSKPMDDVNGHLEAMEKSTALLEEIERREVAKDKYRLIFCDPDIPVEFLDDLSRR